MRGDHRRVSHIKQKRSSREERCQSKISSPRFTRLLLLPCVLLLLVPSVAGVCDFDCSAEDGCIDQVLQCPASCATCTVVCSGKASCSGNSVITHLTSNGIAQILDVECSGEDACKGNTAITAAQGGALNLVCTGQASCSGSSVEVACNSCTCV